MWDTVQGRGEKYEKYLIWKAEYHFEVIGTDGK
jgi:hypothetical protein